MEIENTKSDFLNFYKLFYLDRVKKLSFGILPLILVVSYNMYVRNYEISNFILAFIILLLFFFILLFCLPFGISIFRFNKTISKNPIFFEKKRVITSSEGVAIDSKSNNFFLKWGDISKIEKTGNFLYLVYCEKKLLLIPDRFFHSKKDADLFYKNINEKLGTKNNSTASKKIKSIYNWGYLGFIPLIGFFAGIVLILRGIFQYKDRKLIFIGIGGVLFTIIIYSLLIYQTEYSDSSKQRLRDFCISNMSTLVKDIEFYKVQNGIYPDSLEQVLKYDESVFIYDPLFSKVRKKNTIKYYYRKLNEKYTLFSIGVDRIPGTFDDIYPDRINSGVLNGK